MASTAQQTAHPAIELGNLQQPVDAHTRQRPLDTTSLSSADFSYHRSPSIDDPSDPPPAYVNKPPPYSPAAAKPTPALWARLKRTPRWVLLALALTAAAAIVIPIVLVFVVERRKAQALVDALAFREALADGLRLSTSVSVAFADADHWSLRYVDEVEYDGRDFATDGFGVTLYMEDVVDEGRVLGTAEVDALQWDSYRVDFDCGGANVRGGDVVRDAEVVRLLRRLMSEKEVRVVSKGTAKVNWAKALPKFEVEWNKTLTFPGLSRVTRFLAGNSHAFFPDNTTSNFRATGALIAGPYPSFIQLGRIELDIYGPNETYLGAGNLTVEELPDQGLGKSEITALIDKEVNETLTSVWGDDVLPWYLRPTKVFGQKNESDATSQMDLVEFENWYLTQAMTGMEWRLDIKGFEQI